MKIHRQVLNPRLTRTAVCGETYTTTTTKIKDVTCKRCQLWWHYHLSIKNKRK